MDHQRRIATLEGIAAETRETLRSIHHRLTCFWVSSIGTTFAGFVALVIVIRTR